MVIHRKSLVVMVGRAVVNRTRKRFLPCGLPPVAKFKNFACALRLSNCRAGRLNAAGRVSGIKTGAAGR